jgi:hypothetical protein
MHAAEFPAYDSEAFPVNLGNCQVNSTLVYHQRAMDLRNILLWQVRASAALCTQRAVPCSDGDTVLAGAAAVMPPDARPGCGFLCCMA